MQKKIENGVRVRFAPSPTGYLHVGGLRTALYNYLFAKKNSGTLVLRIEDTDQSREVAGATDVIINDLHWAGITCDEGPTIGGEYGPYLQSQRLDIYHKYAQQLIDEGHAYYCFCTTERLESLRSAQQAAHVPPGYDRHCRELSKQDAQDLLAKKTPYVIRMKLPLTGQITFNDLIRGEVTIAWKALDDQVLIKSDGFPTYHLAVVVDDHLIGITHVIRGEEWLPSTPKHVLLYQYFGWQLPEFAHLPLLLNPDRSKLSKRQGDVSVGDYRIKGYLPAAVINFIALLGWNPGDTREIFTLKELVHEFSLERVGKSGAVFDIQKLNWLNQQYLVKMSAEEILPLIQPLLAQKNITGFSDEYLKQIIDLTKDRAVTLPDFVDLNLFFFTAPTTFDPVDIKKSCKTDTLELMSALEQKYAALEPFDAGTAEHTLRAYAQELGIGAGKLLQPLRLAITGITQGPALFHTMEILGKEESLRRINFACENFEKII